MGPSNCELTPLEDALDVALKGMIGSNSPITIKPFTDHFTFDAKHALVKHVHVNEDGSLIVTVEYLKDKEVSEKPSE